MKTPARMLSILTVAAAAGTVVFFTAVMPSCDQEAAVAGAQRRAFCAATGTTTAEMARALAEEARAHVEEHQMKLQLPADFAERVHVRPSRRKFMMNADRWQYAEKTAHLPHLIRQYYDLRAVWAQCQFDINPESPGIEAGAALPKARRFLDRSCADVSLLTPEARKEWDAWEAKKWAVYPLVDVDPYVYSVQGAGARADDEREAFFFQRHAALRPIQDQLEYLGRRRHDNQFALRE